ncbi:MAG: nucleoside deaminase [Rhodoferax sp.]|nr:nucleoside deaminase [Rhodoferax sp.]MCB2030444.1 nucleoside deaminase [Rhodoferax sp.]MCB2043357.1 nucleoside deaminase [Rhodoferax sp.]
MKPRPLPEDTLRRRQWCAWAAAVAVGARSAGALADRVHPDRRFYLAAEAMRQQAIGWGDQSFGAVLVTADGVVANGPSRVVKDADPDAHAERVAIRAAQRRLGTDNLAGAVLYSTSRPCVACERAAAQAQVARMYHGPGLTDAGRPEP